MDQPSREAKYDLEPRTFAYAQRVRALVRRIPRTLANVEDARQLIRASASVGANYIEATESLGRKDFKMHMRIARKESKEAGFFLRLLHAGDDAAVSDERDDLVRESTEFVKIFSAIIRNLSD